LAFAGRCRPANTCTERATPGYDFYVVLVGAVEIVVNSEGKERVMPATRLVGSWASSIS
jgi:hypothetical protein